MKELYPFEGREQQNIHRHGFQQLGTSGKGEKTVTIGMTKMASLTSSFFCTIPMSSVCKGFSDYRVTYRLSYSRTQPHVACQLDGYLEEEKSISFPRRSFALGTAFGILPGFYNVGEAKAGKRKPPPTEAKPPQEEKNLSAYDAKLLASSRRKEAMKEILEKQKSKGKTIGNAASEAKPMIVSKSGESVTAGRKEVSTSQEEASPPLQPPETISSPPMESGTL